MSESSTSQPRLDTADGKNTDDPILIKRARMANLATAGIRAGLVLYAIASVAFFYSVATSFTPTVTSITAFCLVVGSVLLAPAMVLKYTVKAADRADRDGTW